MNAVELGRSLSARRKAVGLTQAELARRMGTAQPAISRVEAGRALPTLRFLERFARATGQPLELVIDGHSRRPSRDARRARVRQALGSYRFNPWDRNPSDVEARTLIADGLTRDSFEGTKATATRSY